VYFELGHCYRGDGDYDQAEYAFKKAIELSPENEFAYGGLMILYGEMGKYRSMLECGEALNKLRMYYSFPTRNNYFQLKQTLDQRRIKLACMQYPMRTIESLKKIFEEERNIIFIDNEKVFKEALKRGKYEDYFRDNFAGDFGHCTPKGNCLLAENIANVILKEVFGK
jgi:tetratricopeptide (TPR) repeat protein